MTDTDMVERLARIFRDCRTRSQTNPSGDDFKICAADRNDARAAIHAMEEPPMLVIKEIAKAVAITRSGSIPPTVYDQDHCVARTAVSALCRTALGEEKGDG